MYLLHISWGWALSYCFSLHHQASHCFPLCLRFWEALSVTRHRRLTFTGLWKFFCFVFLLHSSHPWQTLSYAHTRTRPAPPTNLPALQLKGWLKVMVVATVMAGWAWRKPSQGTSGITSSEWGLRCLQHTPPDPPSSFYLFPATPSLLLVHLGWACVRPHMALWLFISTLFFY